MCRGVAIGQLWVTYHTFNRWKPLGITKSNHVFHWAGVQNIASWPTKTISADNIPDGTLT
jgi:hypothetical protein